MFLKNPKLLVRSSSFKLITWAALLFVLGSLAINAYTYSFVSSYIYQQSRLDAEEEVVDLAKLYESEGLDAVREDAFEDSDEPVLIRIIDARSTVLLERIPKEWPKLSAAKLNASAARSLAHWEYLNIPEQENEFEIRSAALADGAMLQIAQKVEAREELLEKIRRVYFFALFPIVALAYLIGVFLADRALSPIRRLIGTLSTIVSSGKIDTRVPAPDIGGDQVTEGLIYLVNSLLDKIQTLIQGMRDVLDNVAHDLRTPLMRLRSGAETALQFDSDNSQLRDAVSDSIEESERILVMLNTLMDVSEAEAGALPLNLQETDVSALAHDVIDLYSDVAQEKGIHVSAECPVELFVTADPNWLRQVLANLLDNAIKYTPAGGSVTIRAWNSGSQVNVAVQDTGIGIPADELPKIWERLYRGDKTRTSRGLGLGLSLVRAIVNAHRGSVEVSSESGVGSLFSVSLPCDLQPAARVAANLRSQPFCVDG